MSVIPNGTELRKNNLVDTGVPNDKELSELNEMREIDLEEAPMKAPNYEIIFEDDKNFAYQY